MFLFDKESICISSNSVSILHEDVHNEIANRPARISVSDFRKNFLIKSTMNQNILYPHGCRFMRKGNNGVTLVFEEEPMIRKIFCKSRIYTFNNNNTHSEWSLIKNIRETNQIESLNIDINLHKNDKHYFTLAFPYVIYIISLNDITTEYDLEPQYSFGEIRVFFKSSPIESFYDKLMIANLGNVYNDSYKVCMGNNKPKGNLSSTCYSLINNFWQSEFNDDLTGNIQKYIESDSEIKNYFEWEYRTKENPSFILSAKLLSTNRELKYEINPTDSRMLRLRDDEIYNDLKNIINLGSKYGCNEVKNNSIVKMKNYSLEGRNLEVGDCIYIRNKRYYIYAIYATKQIDGDIRFIIESEETNKLHDIKLHQKFLKYLINQFENRNDLDSITIPDGTVITKENIINIKGSFYGKIQKIRKMKDGLIEIRINNLNFLYETIKNDIKLFNTDNFWVGDILLQSGNTYCLFKKYSNLIIKKVIGEYSKNNYYKFICADVEYNCIVLRFEDTTGYDKKIKGEILDSYLIINQDDVKYKVKTEVIGHINYLASNIQFETMNEYIVESSDLKNFIHAPSSYKNKCLEDNFEISSFINNIYDEKTKIVEFSRYGESNVKFSIGDNIIYVNNFYGKIRSHLFGEHGKSLHELKFKKYEITGFSYNKYFFYIDAKDSTGIIHHIPYIKLGKNGKIIVNFMGIRKVVFEHGNFKVGDHIKCTVGRYPGFSKKDINRIEAIIPISTDVNNPLILCSNFCTLFAHQLENNFEIKNNKPITHIPIDEYKFQPGDLYNRGEMIGYITKRYSASRFGMKNYIDTIMSNYNYERDYYNLDINNIMGIPLPRIKITDMRELSDSIRFRKFIPNSEGIFVDKDQYSYTSR